VNWTDEKNPFSFTLDDQVLKSLPGNPFLLFEFFSQEVLGIFKKNELISTGSLDPRSGWLIKIISWDGKKPVLAGTDLHFSMGGIEIREWKYDIGSAQGTINTEWQYPVNITVVFPGANDGFNTRRITLHPNQKRFWLVLDESHY
jgi:hypothetical protein